MTLTTVLYGLFYFLFSMWLLMEMVSIYLVPLPTTRPQRLLSLGASASPHLRLWTPLRDRRRSARDDALARVWRRDVH